MPIPTRKLGTQGLEVPAMGLGCMGMSAFYGGITDRVASEETSLETIAKAVELGVNFLDTAWIYQSFGAGGGENYTNEELVGKAIKKIGRKNLIIATKFGLVMDNGSLKPSGKPEDVRSQLKDSLERLGTDYIDLYYQHRMDPDTPIEVTMGVLKELVDAGTIRYIGLSECTPEELRRAHAVHPVTAIQIEWSLQTRDVEKQLVPTARELGVGIVAYSPLGRGLLSATFTSVDALPADDWRRSLPRFQAEAMANNAPSKFFELAAKRGVTPAQLALAWVLARGPDVVPIPGTKSPKRLEENVGAASINLTQQECKEIEQAVPAATGDRYADMSNTFTGRQ